MNIISDEEVAFIIARYCKKQLNLKHLKPEPAPDAWHVFHLSLVLVLDLVLFTFQNMPILVYLYPPFLKNQV